MKTAISLLEIRVKPKIYTHRRFSREGTNEFSFVFELSGINRVSVSFQVNHESSVNQVSKKHG